MQNNTQQLERQLETYKELTDKLLSSLDNLTYNKTTQKSNGSLYQNTPNPFTENTEIRFELPSNANFSFLIIHDMHGKEIISYPLNKNINSIIIRGSELQPGMYTYTLIVNHTIIDTKRMILTN